MYLVCFLLCFSDQVKTNNLNIECVSSSSQQNKDYFEGKILLTYIVIVAVKNKL